MKLIVGLGNPGEDYENTRHNVGFIVLDSYLKGANWQKKFDSLFYKTKLYGEDIIFIKPMTYMNNSGIAVRNFKNYFKIEIEDILVIQDDLDMKSNTFKLKNYSSSGGHNGIKSIMNELGTESFARLKIGILNNKKNNVIDFVLSEFSDEEMSYLIDNPEFDKIITSFIKFGFDKTRETYRNNG